MQRSFIPEKLLPIRYHSTMNGLGYKFCDHSWNFSERTSLVFLDIYLQLQKIISHFTVSCWGSGHTLFIILNFRAF